MKSAKNVALFAPIKPPDHPIPSGDRLIAQNLLKALELAGQNVELASRYICYSKRSNSEILETRKSGAGEEADRLIAEYQARDPESRPQIWITYHPYCKAPDWIGPVVSKALDIPYLTVEAARTRQGGPDDEWGPWRNEAEPGIREADRHIVFKPSDREFLAELLGTEENLRELAPFVDLETLRSPQKVSLPKAWDRETPVLVTAGMMRKGKKDRNFYMLAEMLAGLPDEEWNLVVVGGGPELENIQEAFGFLPSSRVHWTGQVEHAEVLGWMQAGDIFIWPGWKEPIGMVYLEAQSQGLPVIAQRSLGVPLVVEHEVTGLLSPEEDYDTMRSNLQKMLRDPDKVRKMGAQAKERVFRNHSIDAAAGRLNEILSEFE